MGGGGQPHGCDATAYTPLRKKGKRKIRKEKIMKRGKRNIWSTFKYGIMIRS